MPNGSLSPWTTSVGTSTASSSPWRLFVGSSALPGGWTGKARQSTAAAPASAAVRQATRAPEERPPAISLPSPIGPSSRSAAITASQAASSCLVGAADLRPATL